MSYQIITDATADISLELLSVFSGITILPMDVILDEQPHTYGPCGDITADQFYTAQWNGNSHIPPKLTPPLIYRALKNI